MDDVKGLVEKIAGDKEAMRVLLEAMLQNTHFLRELTEKISEQVQDGVHLVATTCRR